MKFRILVSDGTKEWWESYDENIENAEEWAKETVKYFNDTLCPYEKPRKLMKVEIEDISNAKHHEWIKRTNGMSVQFRGQCVDLMYCKKCGITGKKYGLNSNVKIDSKYRKKAFQNCDTALKEMGIK